MTGVECNPRYDRNIDGAVQVGLRENQEVRAYDLSERFTRV
jgi:hypothetical protein